MNCLFEKLDRIHENFKKRNYPFRIAVFPLCFAISVVLLPYWCAKK